MLLSWKITDGQTEGERSDDIGPLNLLEGGELEEAPRAILSHVLNELQESHFCFYRLLICTYLAAE